MRGYGPGPLAQLITPDGGLTEPERSQLFAPQ